MGLTRATTSFPWGQCWSCSLFLGQGRGAGSGRMDHAQVGAQRILSLAEEGAGRASSPYQPPVPGATGATAGWVTQVAARALTATAASSVTLWSVMVRNCLCSLVSLA